MIKTLLLSLAALLATTAQAQSAADSASVQAFYRDWSQAAVQRGADGYLTGFSADATILPPDRPPITGHAAIRAWREEQAGLPYLTRPQSISVDEIRLLAGDWVLYRITIVAQRVPKAGGDATAIETKYVDLLRRKPDGGWEIVYRMWSSNRT